jgi:hypothetical protein
MPNEDTVLAWRAEQDSRLFEIRHGTACVESETAHTRNAPHVIYGARVTVLPAREPTTFRCAIPAADPTQLAAPGIEGYGATPFEACAQFDHIWLTGKPKPAAR